jgi:predicted transcriptional regulator
MNDYKNIVGIKFAVALQPVFEERKGKDYIEFGLENNYPNYLINLYCDSPKHGAIIKGKTNYIYGKGFDGVKVEANTKGESFNQLLKKSIGNDELFAGYYLQVIYNLLGQVSDIYHIEFAKVRTNKSLSKFYVKDKWEDTKEKMRCYDAFNPKQVDKENPSQILFVKQQNPKSEVYPLPNYFQGLNYIESDIQVSRHILGNAKDGFVATTLINLNGGEPQEEQKAAVERDLKKKFTGSEGDRVVIMFNSSKDNSAEIVPLSSTMLTKEDFTNVNNLITQEIYACHQVTSPMLFGIKTEGQLGGRSEIRDAYEIFNNTYVNERQQAFEEVFNMLIHLKGDKGTYKIIPVEPLGFEFSEGVMAANMTRNEIREKLGLEPDQVTDVSGMPQAPINSNLASMTGRQFQQLERIKRKFEAGKLTREQAAMMLKNSFGISDEEVSLFLDVSQESNFSEEMDFALMQFSLHGEDASDYEILTRKTADEKQYFADVKKLTELQSNILSLISKDDKITAPIIAEALKVDLKVVNEEIKAMVKAGVLTKDYKPTAKKVEVTKSIFLKYAYDWKSIVPVSERNSPEHPSRPFCVKLMGLNRLYSRKDIENISLQLGYSVFDRAGGWWTMPDGEHSPSCRHEWQALTVIRKS